MISPSQNQNELSAFLFPPEGSGLYFFLNEWKKRVSCPRYGLLVSIEKEGANYRRAADASPDVIAGVLTQALQDRFGCRGERMRANEDGFFLRVVFAGRHELS
jgi:hypothetical protein